MDWIAHISERIPASWNFHDAVTSKRKCPLIPPVCIGNRGLQSFRIHFIGKSSKEIDMHSRIFLIIGVLVLAMGACTPAQPTVSVTGTPVSITDTSAPLPTATNMPLPTPLGVPVASPALIHIAFQDANNGWGVASNGGGSILRTGDGGTTWVNVTPPGLTGIGYSTDLSVLDINTAWVQVPNADFFTGTLYRTSYGGLTWTSVGVQFGGANIQFLDASTGLALADRGAGAGSNSVEMYQTSDGGATWLSVFNNDPTRPDSSNSLPLSGIKNGMTFLDANTGWVTGTRPMDGDVYLFITHDGGISWEQQSIPLPAGYATYQYMPQAPIFFGSDGFLPLTIYLSGSTGFTFYTTHDAGTTWTGDPTNANSMVPPGRYAFADALHGWCWDGGTNLYFTADGAQTWSGTLTSLDLSDRLSQLEFVPGPAGGFTGWALTSVDDAGRTQLYKTTDNGVTWTALIP
jgi:photosystem II stability/assembly factor-like uncharacterized protein